MARTKKQLPTTNTQQDQVQEPVLESTAEAIMEVNTTSEVSQEPVIEASTSTEAATELPTPIEPPTPVAPTPVETISVGDACNQLGMPEQMLRLSLQPSHPDDFDTLKQLPLDEFKIIAETLQRKALGSSEPIEPPQQPQPIQSNAIQHQQPSVPTDQREKLETGTNNALAQFAGEYVITLDKITSALAYTSSKASLNNFVTIHSNVFRDGLENYLEEFADEMTTAAHAISQVNAKDFLHNQGILPKQRRVSKAVAEILNLAPRV